MNRAIKDKPGGLIGGLPGLVDQLKRSLATYSESGANDL